MDRIAIVTGAGSGIGRACALALLAEGWQVALLGRRADALEATRSAAGPAASRAHVYPCDVSDDVQVAASFDAVAARHGRLDLLFNNAGGGLGGKTPDLVTAAEWRRVVASSTTAPSRRMHRGRARLPTRPPNMPSAA
jgi:NAD(P)-dependent dehydrogenase (short-subunit alcohol dehydrogenase family)